MYAQVLADQTQKYFWVFYMFFKVILYFHDFSFCSNCIFVFFFKNWIKGCFARSSQLRASHEICLREIKKITFSYRESRYYLASISQLNSSHEMFFGKNWKFSNLYKGYCDCLTTFSRLRASRKSFSMSRNYFATLYLAKNACFQFYVVDVTGFQTLSFPSLNLSRTTLQPKISFH